MTSPANLLEWLASLPLEAALTLVYVPALLVTAAGTVLVRWAFEDAVAPGSSVTPTKVQYMAEIYSALLGFLVVAAYAQYDDTRTSVRREVEELKLIRQVAGQFEPPVRSGIERAVAGYARAVVDDEWRLMAFGHESASVDAAIDAMFASLPRVESAAPMSTALVVNRAQELIRSVAEARVTRVTAPPDTRVADLLSGVLVLVTGLSISIAWFLRGPSVVLHLLLGGMLVTAFLSLIFLAVELIYPFAGELSIPPDDFRQLLS